MGIFGRKRRTEGESAGRHAAPEADDTIEDDAYDDEADELSDVSDGPFDVADFEDDGVPRIDLGSVKVPVPDGSQVQVEMDPETGGVRAVHVVTEQGQITVSAYAAPRSGGLWREVSTELAEQLRADGAKVNIGRGGGAWRSRPSSATSPCASSASTGPAGCCAASSPARSRRPRARSRCCAGSCGARSSTAATRRCRSGPRSPSRCPRRSPSTSRPSSRAEHVP